MSEKPINIILTYRPPNSGRENLQMLCEMLDTAAADNTIAIGDFNLPDIEWTSNRAGNIGKYLLSTIQQNNYEQLINFPTHDKGNILDLVVTNCAERIISIAEGGKLGNSDHCIIEIVVDIGRKKNAPTRKIICWDKADFMQMKRELSSVDWAATLNGKSVEHQWEKFKNILEASAERYIPVKTITNSNRPRWLSKDLVKLVRKKKRAWKEYKISGTLESREKYISIEKDLKVKIRKAKRKQERELTKKDDRNGKKFTNYIKTKTKVRTGIGPLKKDDGSPTADEKEMSEILNKFFTSVFTNEDGDNLPTKVCETNVLLSDIVITEGKIIEKINALKKDSAPGPDNIHPRLLKELKEIISRPLAIIFRHSLDTGAVPQEWRKAKVIPIYKKGAKSEPGNYRPVSLTSVPCKLLEGLIKDAIMKHLMDENLIKDSQHGFMPGRSCTTNLTIFLETLTKAIDSGKAADVFYLDFAKAFDKVPHKRLLIKVQAKGISGKILDWLRAWLSNRTQHVSVGEEQSEESNVESGVPQGTVMGPPLFTIFIDDIDDVVKLVELLIKFADDNKGVKIIENSTDRDKLQETLDNLCRWAETWAMQFNIEKCKIMHVGRSNPGYTYYMAGKELKSVDEETDVGVVIHKSLKPTKQCERAANTARAVLGLIQRNFHYRDRYVYMRLYKQYVRPHLEFSSPAWAPWTTREIDLIEAVQKKAVGMVAGLTAKTYEEKCRELGIQTLEERRNDQDMAQVYRFRKGIGGLNGNLLFESIPVRSGPVTRLAATGNNLKLPTARLDIRKNSFAVRTVSRWNELPDQIKESGNIVQFKNRLKTHNENGGRPPI
jgi:Reverse transcriptase (RNA-dependent DNA polymerase)/Endonuclease-reverse transcriptase